MGRLTAQGIAGLAGLMFVVLGVLGFVPGVVRHYGELRWWHGSEAELFGIFRSSISLNLGYLGAGVVGLAGRRLYPSAAGVTFFCFGVYGLLATNVALNRADDWLHIGLGAALVYIGLAVSLPRLHPAT